MTDEHANISVGSPPSPSAWQQFWNSSAPKRIAVTVAILTIYRLGLLIPASHVSTASLYHDGAGAPQYWPDLIARISYFAIGLTPVISILIIAEAFKLAFSDVREWSQDAASRATFNRVVVVLSLLLAALQGYGISVALEQANDAMQNSPHPLLLETGAQGRTIYIVSVVAATALCFWLADQITRHGLGSGIWFIYLLGPVIGLAALPADFATRVQIGELAPSSVALTAAVLLASAAAVVTLTRLWLQWAEITDVNPANGMRPDAIALSIMVWPPLLASSCAALLYWPLSLAMSDADTSSGSHRSILIITIMSGLLAWLFTALMVRTFPEIKARDQTRTRVLAGLTVLLSFGLTVAFEALVWFAGVPVNVHAPSFIAIIAILATLLPRDLTLYLSAPSEEPPITDADFEQR